MGMPNECEASVDSLLLLLPLPEVVELGVL